MSHPAVTVDVHIISCRKINTGSTSHCLVGFIITSTRVFPDHLVFIQVGSISLGKRKHFELINPMHFLFFFFFFFFLLGFYFGRTMAQKAEALDPCKRGPHHTGRGALKKVGFP